MNNEISLLDFWSQKIVPRIPSNTLHLTVTVSPITNIYLRETEHLQAFMSSGIETLHEITSVFKRKISTSYKDREVCNSTGYILKWHFL